MKVILALPAYNEEKNLPVLLAAFQDEMQKAGLAYLVVVVDDGSQDGTQQIVSEWSGRMPLELVTHARNRGLGATISDALEQALKTAAEDDVIVTMDADNTHSPALIPEMAAKIRDGYDLVIASRYRRGAKVVGLSASRQALSMGARLLFQTVFPIRGVRDYTSGFRAYRPAILRRAFVSYQAGLVTEGGFACMAEILLKLGRMPVKTCEIPLVLRYDRKDGPSKMRVGSTVIRTLQLVARNRFHTAR